MLIGKLIKKKDVTIANGFLLNSINNDTPYSPKNNAARTST